MTDTLALEVVVSATPDHAFDPWVRRCGTWWPAAKTVSGAPEAVVFEPRSGGRIYERAGDGSQHDWGRVVTWEPPSRLAFTWHLFFDPSEATEVEVTFTPVGEETLVRLQQSGFDRLGAAGESRRENTAVAWRMLVDRFAAAAGRRAGGG